MAQVYGKMNRCVVIKFPDNATPLHDYSGLIPKWVLTLEDLNKVEAENIAYAQAKYLKRTTKKNRDWFTIPTLKKIHYSMFNNVWTWAGIFRKTGTSIGIAPHMIPMKLGELCHHVTMWDEQEEHLSIIEQAAYIHHQLVYIHPFENGNGRFSRLIADRYLLAHNWQYPHWPSQLQDTGNTRIRYIKSLKAADQGCIDELVQLMIEFGASPLPF